MAITTPKLLAKLRRYARRERTCFHKFEFCKKTFSVMLWLLIYSVIYELSGIQLYHWKLFLNTNLVIFCNIIHVQLMNLMGKVEF